MADFNNCIPIILRNEGGYVNNPNDPGGCTNFGISMNFIQPHPQYLGVDEVTCDVIHDMTQDQAVQIYQTFWWNAYGYGTIAFDAVATKILDFAVNAGPERGNKYAQQACVNLGVTISVDGQLGPQSYNAINSLIAGDQGTAYLNMYRAMQTAFYNQIVQKHPNEQEFLSNWLKRVNSC